MTRSAPHPAGAEPSASPADPSACSSCTASPATRRPCGAWPRRWSPPATPSRCPVCRVTAPTSMTCAPPGPTGPPQPEGASGRPRRPDRPGSSSPACRWEARSPAGSPPVTPSCRGSSASGQPSPPSPNARRGGGHGRGGETVMDGIGSDMAASDVVESADKVPSPRCCRCSRWPRRIVGDLGRIECPLLLFTSPQDHVVPPTDSDLLARRCRDRWNPVSCDRSYHVATLDLDRRAETLPSSRVGCAPPPERLGSGSGVRRLEPAAAWTVRESCAEGAGSLPRPGRPDDGRRDRTTGEGQPRHRRPRDHGVAARERRGRWQADADSAEAAEAVAGSSAVREAVSEST